VSAQGPVATHAVKAAQARTKRPRTTRERPPSAVSGGTLLPLDVSRIAALSGAEQMESEAKSLSTRMVSMRPEVWPASMLEAPERLRSTSRASVTDEVPTVREALHSPAVRLREEDRELFEPYFGYDLREVSLHIATSASESARMLHARAYTVGSDVVFARGAYNPGTPSGQQLLAHELVHVIQQAEGAAWGIQRQAVPDAPSDAGAPPDAAPPTQADLDKLVDDNEADARAKNPDLPQIDRKKQSAVQNEAAVNAIVMDAFGGDDELNKGFESLSPFVIHEVDRGVGADPVARTANRKQFFVRMRLYFGSWAELLDHFRNFVKIDRGKVHVVLHQDAAARLNRALDVLEKKGHPFPEIGVGFGLRGYHTGAIQGSGMMIHAMGYAFDVAATENPKIGVKKDDPYVLGQVVSSVDPKHARMDMDKWGTSVIEAMGKRTEKDTSLSAAADPDPVAKKFFADFDQKFHEFREGSLGFLGTISKDPKDKLLDIRKKYHAKLKELAAEKAKGRKADSTIVAALEAERIRLLAAIPPLLTEWITSLDAAINKTLKDHPGMDKMRPPEEISRVLKAAQGTVATDKKTEAGTRAANAKAIAARDAAQAALSRAEAQESRARTTADLKKAQDATSAARKNFMEKSFALAGPFLAEGQSQQELTKATQTRDKLAADYKASADPKLKGAWDWLTSLRELRNTLATPDLKSSAGIKKFEGLTTGDLKHIAPVENPPLLRLLDMGFFNPKGAFDLEFYEEMVHSGFWAGATWQIGWVDPMHFELLEGRDRIQTPGKL
jgi:hypothetical protein